jgi:hypothetical protein
VAAKPRREILVSIIVVFLLQDFSAVAPQTKCPVALRGASVAEKALWSKYGLSMRP